MKLNQFSTAIAAILLSGCASGIATVVTTPDFGPSGKHYLDHVTENDGAALNAATKLSSKAEPIEFGRSGSLGKLTLRAPVLSGSQVQNEIRRLGDCMLQQWPLPKPQIDYIVMSGIAPSAEALPNQIAVNVGLLDSEDVDGPTVAFVLAHELSHVLLQHYAREEFREMQKKVLSTAAGAAVLAAMMSEMRLVRQGDDFVFVLEDEEQVAKLMLATALAHAVSYGIGEGLIESSWARKQELESDRLAADLVRRAGIPPDNAFKIFDILQDFHANQKTRIEAFGEIAEARMNEAVKSKDLNRVLNTGTTVLAEATLRIAHDFWDFLDLSHPSPALRSEELGKYLAEIEGVPEQVGGVRCDTRALERAMRRTEVKRTRDAIIGIQRIEDLLQADKIADARKAYGAALKGPLANHPVTRYHAYLTERRAGNNREALTHLTQIRFDADTPLVVFTTLVSEYIVFGDYAAAKRIIRIGEERFSPDNFFPARLQIAIQEKNSEELSTVMAECKLSEFDAIPTTCDRIMSNRKDLSGNENLFERIGNGLTGGLMGSIGDPAI